MTQTAAPVKTASSPTPVSPPAANPPVSGAGRTGLDGPAALSGRVRELNEHERWSVERYVRVLAEAMALGHWTISISWDEACAEDCDAQIAEIPGRYAAVLWLHDHFFALALAEQRRVLCHELLHLHLAGMREAARLGFKAIDAKAMRRAVMRYVTEAEEHAVDTLSCVLGERLPLPTWAETPNPERALSSPPVVSSAPIVE